MSVRVAVTDASRGAATPVRRPPRERVIGVLFIRAGGACLWFAHALDLQMRGLSRGIACRSYRVDIPAPGGDQR